MTQSTQQPSSKTVRLAGLAALAVTAVLLAPGCASIQTRLEMKRGNNAFNTQKFEEAVDAYQKVLAIDPTYKEAHFNLGLSYVQLYQPGSTHEKDIEYSMGAIKAFKDFLQMEPDNEKVESYLLEICEKSRNYEEAIAFFEDASRRHPDDVKTIILIGGLYSKVGDIDKALEWMQKRIELEPDNAEAYYTMGVNCWARSYNHMDLTVEERFAVLDRGLAALDKAIALRTDYFEAFTYKNLILRQKAMFDPNPDQKIAYNQQADELLKKALEIRNRQAQQQQQAAQQPSKAGS